MAQSISARPATDAAGDTFLPWPASTLAELAAGFPQACVSGLAGWMALQNELWSYGSAVQAEWTKALAQQTADLPSLLPPWMVWYNGAEQLA